LPADQAAAAQLTGSPASSPAPAAALSSAAAAIAASTAAARTAAGAAAAACSTANMTPNADSPAAAVPCACGQALQEVSTALQQISTVFSGLLQALFDERAATTADFLSLRRALAVVLANSVSTKSDVAKIHSLANATSLSVGSMASASSALAYNGAAASGDQPLHQSPRQSQQQQVGGGTPAVAIPQNGEPVEVPWAIPVQVCVVCVCRGSQLPCAGYCALVPVCHIACLFDRASMMSLTLLEPRLLLFLADPDVV